MKSETAHDNHPIDTSPNGALRHDFWEEVFIFALFASRRFAISVLGAKQEATARQFAVRDIRADQGLAGQPAGRATQILSYEADSVVDHRTPPPRPRSRAVAGSLRECDPLGDGRHPRLGYPRVGHLVS
ncbi:hypothetical protein ACFV0R_14640 [Streptomyces sp. NPDC059578]|uniref:hypothetical protein n=1 Tax=unclassified Streptomyces TaxID=2593676 RepID=UPI00365BBC53